MPDSTQCDNPESDQVQTTNGRKVFPKYWIVLGLLIVAHAAFVAYFNPEEAAPGAYPEIALYMMFGCLLSQAALFALWSVFAQQPFYQRFLWAFLLLALVSFIEELGALRQTQNVGGIMMLNLPLFIMATVGLLPIRRYFGWRLDHSQTEIYHSDYSANQFGIKHLIILTTITAVAFGLLRCLLLINTRSNWLPSIAEFTGFTSMCLALLIPIIIIPWHTLAYCGIRVWLIIFTMLSFGIIDLAVIFIEQKLDLFAPNKLQLILYAQLGAGLSVLFSTLVLRLCGFRLVREKAV